MKEIDIKYKILNPGGNKTAIVIGNNYTDEEKEKINNKILRENRDIEQVGFINQNKYRLEMAGGEFCVNATRCAVWEYLKGIPGKIEIEVSGYKNKILGEIKKDKQVYINMPIKNKITNIIEIKEKFNLIKLDGILIIILDEEYSKEYIGKLKRDEEKTKLELKEIMKKIDTQEKAVGIILLEEQKEKIKINPIIWVKTIDTLYYETACGSGSLATAIYKNYTDNMQNLEVIQPSGYSIKIEINKEREYLENVIISGRVMEE